MGKQGLRAAILFGLIEFLTVFAIASPPSVDTAGKFRFGELAFTPTAIYRPGWNLARIQPATAVRSGDGSLSARHEVSAAGSRAGSLNWSLRSATPDSLSELCGCHINHRSSLLSPFKSAGLDLL